MGYVFEELIRKFNEENNEEAGEHFTPREVIELMTNIEVKDELPPVITVYDPVWEIDSMLTESQNFATTRTERFSPKQMYTSMGRRSILRHTPSASRT